MQVSDKQIYADFSAEQPTLSWAHPNSCDNACQPIIRWPFQLFVPYHLSQEALRHMKTPSSHCYLTHGGVQPLGSRWHSGTLSLTLLFCDFLSTLQWLQLMLKNDIYLHWVACRFSLCTWLRWLPTKASVFLPHQWVYTWGLRDLYSLDNLRSPGLTGNWINNNH